jgi:hypothetical protein
MKDRLLLLSILVVLLLVVALQPNEVGAASDSSPEGEHQVQTRIGLGQGYESNVFFSETHPQSDMFTLSEATIHATLKPTSKSSLYMDFFGSQQHFWKFHQADRTFLDQLLDYQYFIANSLGIGFSNTLSYSNLKLFDTEGNTLPREKFGSLSERVRLYGMLYPTSSLDLELGSSYRIMDVEETPPTPTYSFPSLDFKEIGADLSSRFFFTPFFSTRLKYELSRLSYDELQAYNRDTSFTGLTDPNNPRLRMKRQDLSLNLKYKRKSTLDLELIGRYRMNDDTFQDDLTYRQREVKTRVTVGNVNTVSLFIELYYNHRDYIERRKELYSEERLKEEYLIGSVNLTRNLTSWLQAYFKYQWIHRLSNAPLTEFNDHNGMVGLMLFL